MVIFGLCGPSGSGKTTVGEIFTELGGTVLDCDEIYHRLVSRPSACLRAIGKEFGEEMIAGGKLDRARLRSLVFSDEEQRKRLNEITHAFVKRELKKKILLLQKENAPFCVIDAPLLFEAGLDAWCDGVIGVTAPEESRIARLIERDGISKEAAVQRMSKQIGPDELRPKCRFWIENDGDLKKLRSQVLPILKEFEL